MTTGPDGETLEPEGDVVGRRTARIERPQRKFWVRASCALVKAFLVLHAIWYVPRWAGCSPNARHRGSGRVETSVEELERDRAERNRVARASWEYHDEFDVGIVELDDEGVLWRRAQLDEAVKRIQSIRASDRHEGVQLIVFVHGWKHNADVCDDSMCCFREMLRYMARTNPQSNRRVVGLFVGWRGELTRTPVYDVLSFWDRKDAAHRIATQGDLRTIVVEAASAVRDPVPNERTSNASRIVVLGHSMGAAMTFDVLQSDFITHRRSSTAREGVLTTSPPIADLFVLVNPAFEASRARAVRVEDNTRTARMPRVLIVTSETDDATKYLFRLGRGVSTLFGSFRDDERARANTALGHYAPYRTHRLRSGRTVLEADVAANPGPCGCGARFADLASGRRTELAPNAFGDTTLESVDGRPVEDPAMIVALADRSVIHGHGDIYNPVFVDFLSHYLRTIDRMISAQRAAESPSAAKPP